MNAKPSHETIVRDAVHRLSVEVLDLLQRREITGYAAQRLLTRVDRLREELVEQKAHVARLPNAAAA